MSWPHLKELFGSATPTHGFSDNALAVAQHLLASGEQPQTVEICAEFFARAANRFSTPTLNSAQMKEAVAWLGCSDALVALIGEAADYELGERGLCALSMHLIDIAEAMAMMLYVPELPVMCAKSERTGDAARAVGLARRLRG